MDDLFKKIDNIVATVSDHISPETMMALMVILVGVLLILLLLSRTRGPSKREVKSMTTLLARVEQLEVSLGMLRSEVKEAVDRFKDIAADVRDDVMPRPKRGPGEGSGGSQGSTGGTGGTGGGSRGGGILGAASAEASPGSLAQGLLKTRSSFLDRITGLFKRAPRFEASMLDDLEELLISSDVGARCAGSLVEQVKVEAQAEEKLTEAGLKDLLRKGILGQLIDVSPEHQIYRPTASPLVVLVVGVNGVGKTTTVAKLAARYVEQGKKVVLVAADTFRAAAVEQLIEWGKRLDVKVISGAADAKPGTVVFDGMVAAKEAGAEVILIDTAGRLHTKSNLMQELEGIRNSIRKHVPEGPHETVLVLDGVSGQNALQQAREFNEAVDVTGIVITKLDGTPRGGILVAISQELKLPVFFVGVGEKARDLVPFSKHEFVDALLGEGLTAAVVSGGGGLGVGDSGHVHRMATEGATHFTTH